MHLGSLESTQEARVALTLLSCFPNFPRASITRYSCFEKGCLQYEENLNATMPKVIMDNGGFTVA